jgi:SSS family solute:Na+ symporter
VKHLLPNRSERFFLRFSKISTIAWAVALIFVAYLSRKVDFVLNAAFALRGLTSGALLGGLILAVFWKRGRAVSVIVGMFASLVVLSRIQNLPRMEWTERFWKQTIGTEIYWPWYTLIGVLVTVSVAWLVNLLVASKLPPPAGDPGILESETTSTSRKL